MKTLNRGLAINTNTEPALLVNGIEIITEDNALFAGNSAKTSYNRISGYTKIDYRPTGGGTNSYALQARFNVGGTSGLFQGFDNETHLTKTGTATIRSTQGVAVVDVTYTATDTTLIGIYGQARADGTVAGSSFMAGLYGLIEEGGGAITASHVCSAWLDSHRNTAITGSHQLLYMTNNGTATMDEAIFLYGGDKISKFIKFDTCDTMVSDTAETAGASKKIAIDIDGTTYYINAYAGA